MKLEAGARDAFILCRNLESSSNPARKYGRMSRCGIGSPQQRLQTDPKYELKALRGTSSRQAENRREVGFRAHARRSPSPPRAATRSPDGRLPHLRRVVERGHAADRGRIDVHPKVLHQVVHYGVIWPRRRTRG